MTAAVGCLDGRAYPCATDVECRVDGVQGVCHGSGFCAYPDGRCPSELRYGPAAGDGLSLECVPPGGADGNDTHAFVATESSSSSPPNSSGVAETVVASASSGGCEECVTPPGECFEPVGACEEDGCVYPPLAAGVACTLADPCVIAAACDGSGNCLVTRGMTCDNPPGPCDSHRGTCEKDGTCSYEPRPVGSPCDDGDGCTTGESCGADGVCDGGDPCATDDPCEVASCIGGACQFDPLEDGASCGPDDADRCCGGVCVDISTDEDHCGGCGVTCDADDSCESVAATASCAFAPAATTGRCTCDAANADCPIGQICRTVLPFDNRCTPDGVQDCVNSFQDVSACPNYCYYP